MEIRSFLFMAKRQFNFFTILGLVIVISGCSVKTTRTSSAPQPKTGIVTKADEAQPLPKPFEPDSANPNALPAQPAKNSQAVTLPKFGLIFSGGGAKAWAHIGVLKELQKLKWPISAVAGFEWGSVVAAAYAQNLSANEVEWELSKLKDFDKWDQFIKAVFSKKMTADLKVPFVCPSLNIAKQNIYLLNRGQLDQLLPFCIASAGLIKPISQSVASMTDINSLAQHLRSSGVSRVILINVLSQETKRSFLSDYESSDNILWAQSAALMMKKPSGVDDMIEINLDNFGIKDLDKRRDIVAKGSELSYTQLKKLAEKYGL